MPKAKKKRSFKSCSTAQLIRLGYDVDDGERKIPGTQWTKDLFGFGDLIAFDADEILLVQYTARGDVSRRHKKIIASPIARRWINAPGRAIEIWGWYDFEKYHRVRLTPEDFLTR